VQKVKNGARVSSANWS